MRPARFIAVVISAAVELQSLWIEDVLSHICISTLLMVLLLCLLPVCIKQLSVFRLCYLYK